MKQIIPDLYYITGLPVGRVYCIKDADGLTLIDSSISGMTGRIQSQIESAGFSITDVKRLLVTHAHPDHIGSLFELQRRSGAQVITSEQDRAVVEGKSPVARRAAGFRPPQTYIKGTSVTRVVHEGDVISEAFGGLHVLFTPGHSPGHLTFWQPQKRVGFCGDVIFHMFGLRPPFGFLTVDAAQNKRSIAKVAALDARIMCFGHGDPLTENTSSKISAFAHSVGAA
ncbi:MAG: MBL fold metallo-hydrolase [Chloroflexi bacterium]|nr:MBL fold metallo-hydrolase [Chloroflexota bacterium]